MRRLPLILAAGLFAAGCAPQSPAPPAASPPPDPVEPVGPPSDTPLALGTQFPPFQAAGWVNGPPPEFNALGVRGVVVDLWATWCPYCRYMAPELVKLHHRYESQGVRFVSLTNMGQVTVDGYVRQFGIAWPNGYGSAVSTFAAYGARHTAMPTPGYEVAPTIYLLNADGTIRWCDQRARSRHVAPADLAKDLAAQLDELLAEDAAPPPLGGP